MTSPTPGVAERARSLAADCQAQSQSAGSITLTANLSDGLAVMLRSQQQSAALLARAAVLLSDLTNMQSAR